MCIRDRVSTQSTWDNIHVYIYAYIGGERDDHFEQQQQEYKLHMGLAFLNKKSWHTGSFQNIEKVWIAEQKKKENDKRTAESIKKLKEERHVEELKRLQVEAGLIPASHLNRMDWMYEWGSKATQKNTEDYLTGKPIDEKKTDDKKPPFQPLFKESTVNPQNEAFTKLHEDPLFLIQQEQLKRKKEIMENPMKMKNIYKEVEEKTQKPDKLSKKSKKAKKEKKEKKSKKEKKKNRERSSESVDGWKERKRSSRDDSVTQSPKKQRAPSSSADSGREKGARSSSSSSARSSGSAKANKKDFDRKKEERHEDGRREKGRSSRRDRSQSHERSRSRSRDRSRDRRRRNPSRSRDRSDREKNRRSDRDHSSRNRSRSRSKSEERRKHKSSHSERDDRSSKINKEDADIKKQSETNGIKEKPSLFDEYMRKRLGPLVMQKTEDTFKPDFNINKRRVRTSQISEEEREKMLEQMKKNAEELRGDRKKQLSEDAMKDEPSVNQRSGEFLRNLKNEVYNSEKDINDISDNISRKKFYYTKKLENNTFKKQVFFVARCSALPVVVNSDREDTLTSTAFKHISVSYTHLRAHETRHDLVCRLLLEKKKKEA
eukprot:TRINITY_DN9853_c0_g1_i1.p1 TRINITY_DN9853_c0_g1~~TRINITY_DN9853_c0_g1_i1.p1  ORF type:complete len:601 (+),score=130.20 TRINITY_DN9853_c0_g1_i1:64-1866(+)